MRKIFIFLLVLALMMSAVPSVFAGYTPTANGCGPENGPSVPNYFYYYRLWGPTDVFPFINACNPHDICYGTLGMSRATCDNQFLSNLLAICSANGRSWASRTYCQGLAYTYYSAVALFGGWASDAAQAKARAG
jgi:hypothetical protein